MVGLTALARGYLGRFHFGSLLVIHNFCLLVAYTLIVVLEVVVIVLGHLRH